MEERFKIMERRLESLWMKQQRDKPEEKFKIPHVIYLQCHNDDGELLQDGHDITWSEDDIDGHNVKYIRVLDNG